MEKCSHSNCNKPIKYKSPKLLCATHYYQLWRKNKNDKKGGKSKKQKTCSVRGCIRKTKYKSPRPLCATHYHQWWRKNKKVDYPKKMRKRGRPKKTETKNIRKEGVVASLRSIIERLF